ncbi:hypothetical protein BJX68DRAFT_220490 [Aspergillus pseudodeflectus]|uniref:Cyanovirin-N domain-containing protein n=1 Tax=Aspergillus pseudodeflectus TaxID=176178 RepID=A0ABR4JC56_9EURO
MPFSYTSKNVHLRPDGKELYLCATCKTDDDDWVYSEIRLDDKLNVLPDDTVFIDDPRVSYDTLELKSGSVLSGVVSDGTAFTFCLEFYFSNYNGRLGFDAPHDDVRGRMVKYTLNDDAVLRGLVVGKDGRLHYSELPLGDHYENKDGYLVPKKDGHFNWTARSFWIGSD